MGFSGFSACGDFPTSGSAHTLYSEFTLQGVSLFHSCMLAFLDHPSGSLNNTGHQFTRYPGGQASFRCIGEVLGAVSGQGMYKEGNSS